MKDSLIYLGVNSSGLLGEKSSILVPITEKDACLKLDRLKNDDEKEKYLREVLKDKPHGFLKPKKELANLLKDKDPAYAFELLVSACLSSPIDPENYYLHAMLAYSHNSWQIAKVNLETAKWLCLNCDEKPLLKIESMLKNVQERILQHETDNSKNDFWKNKFIDRYWVLDKLYIQSKYHETEYFAFKLLDTFPEDIKNFHTVLKALSLLEDKNIILKYQKYIKENMKDELSKNLYLGISEYFMGNFNKSEEYLSKVLEKEPLNSKASFYLAMHYILLNNIDKFKYISKRILPESETDYIALYFISSALTDVKMDENVFPDNKNIAREISKIIKLLIKHEQQALVLNIIEKFKLLKYFLILPYLQVYLADMFLEKNMVNEARKVLIHCENHEVHRLNAWIYRIEGKKDLAEKELAVYRSKCVPDKEEGFFCKLVDLNLPKKAPDSKEETFYFVEKAYGETNEVIHRLSNEYGLDEMTCVETGCQDCCTKTFPLITYTEYLYMREWVEKQSNEFKSEIQERSKKIVEMYRERYKKEPPFLVGDKDSKLDYPSEFKFHCTFVGENKCNIYEARPFTCRAYGFSSFDGYTFKGCNYFFEQFKKSNKLWNYRKVINAKSFFNFAELTDEKLIGKKIRAPIPIWFAKEHDEIVKQLKETLTLNVK